MKGAVLLPMQSPHCAKLPDTLRDFDVQVVSGSAFLYLLSVVHTQYPKNISATLLSANTGVPIKSAKLSVFC